MNIETMEAVFWISILMISFGIMFYLITRNKIMIVKIGDKTELELIKE